MVAGEWSGYLSFRLMAMTSVGKKGNGLGKIQWSMVVFVRSVLAYFLLIGQWGQRCAETVPDEILILRACMKYRVLGAEYWSSSKSCKREMNRKDGFRIAVLLVIAIDRVRKS